MCGIFAFIKSANYIVSDDIANQIITLLKHRGPDAQNTLQDESVFLGHTRLAIIDLDKAADQPFFNQTKDLSIVYNGECYNYKKLRQQLIEMGRKFRTTSDTEVILMMYETYGPSFITQLEGMFSFVISDHKNKSYLVARDRLGIKPLYYLKNEKGYFFSSEIKPLLLFHPAKLNHEALNCYLNYRYISGPKTMFEDIFEVSPGTSLEIKNQQMTKNIYWDLSSINYPAADSSPQELFTLLEQTIKDEAISDVPVGSFISGGIDSSLITSILATKNPQTNAFSLSFNRTDDESFLAEEFCLKNKINFHRHVFTQKEFSLYKDAIWHLENPIGDSILAPTLALSRFTAKKVKVVLSGEGADEIFAGYIHHHFLMNEDRILTFLPRFVIKLAENILRWVPHQILNLFFNYPAHLGDAGKTKLLDHLKNLHHEFLRYQSLTQLFDHATSKIFNFKLHPDYEMKNYWENLKGPFGIKLKKMDLKFWTNNYTLHRLDRLTMANSLEARVPYYGHSLVEFMLRLDIKKQFSFLQTKSFFRKSVPSNVLPKMISKRKKFPFFLPSEQFFNTETIQGMIKEIKTNAKIRGIYNYEELESWLEFKNGIGLIDSKRLQALYNLEIWFQLFIDKTRDKI